MGETVKKGDFVELDYTGVLKEGDVVFDTTEKEIAQKEGVFNSNMAYGPVIVCLGEGNILLGLENALIGREIGKDEEIELSTEEAFGKKDSKLLKLIPEKVFRNQKINPVPGLQVNVDGTFGIVKTSSGGRVIVDFNHPLSGQDLKYKVKMIRKVSDPKEKLQGYLSVLMNMDKTDIELELNDGTAVLYIHNELPEESVKSIKDKIMSLIPEIKDFKLKKKQDKKDE